MCSPQAHVRFTPNSDHKSRHRCTQSYVRFGSLAAEPSRAGADQVRFAPKTAVELDRSVANDQTEHLQKHKVVFPNDETMCIV